MFCLCFPFPYLFLFLFQLSLFLLLSLSLIPSQIVFLPSFVLDAKDFLVCVLPHICFSPEIKSRVLFLASRKVGIQCLLSVAHTEKYKWTHLLLLTIYTHFTFLKHTHTLTHTHSHTRIISTLPPHFISFFLQIFLFLHLLFFCSAYLNLPSTLPIKWIKPFSCYHETLEKEQLEWQKERRTKKTGGQMDKQTIQIIGRRWEFEAQKRICLQYHIHKRFLNKKALNLFKLFYFHFRCSALFCIHTLLFILTRVWVLGTTNAGRKYIVPA